MAVTALPDPQGIAPCQPDQPLTLVVADGGAGDLVGQAARHGMCLAMPGEQRGGGFLSAGEAVETQIIRGLSSPGVGFVELSSRGLADLGAESLQVARQGGLVLSLTTRAAFSHNTLGLMMNALRERLPPSKQDCLDLVEICLGEAISNAVMHGNLEVPGFLRVDVKGFARFRQVMQERLQDAVLAERRIEITARFPATENSLVIAVSDQGKGFDLESHLGKMVDAEAKSGRGLALIAQLCAGLHGEDEGRRLVMTFS